MSKMDSIYLINHLKLQFSQNKTDNDIYKSLSEIKVSYEDLVAVIRQLIHPAINKPKPKTKLNKNNVANRLGGIADRHYADGKKNYADRHYADGKKHYCGDVHMLDVYEKDAIDLNTIGDSIRNGEYLFAMKLAENLDTLVRDLIPIDIWDWMENKCDEW